MTTATLTTTGITNPSSTTRAYTGGDSSDPAGATFSGGDTEFSTSDYTAAGADDANSVAYTNGSDSYVGERIELFVPADKRVITQIDFGIKGSGDNGYSSGYDWKLYIWNTNTVSWEYIGISTSSVTGSKTTNLTYYVDANYRIKMLMISSLKDGNGSGPNISCQYAYATITYTEASTFVPQIIMSY